MFFKLFAVTLLFSFSTFATSFDSIKISTFENYAFSTDQGHITDAVVVMKGEQLVYEKYSAPNTKSTPYRVWSIAKSITSALIGIAETQGIVEIHSSVKKYFPKIQGKWVDQLKLIHLLEMSSGLQWRETYEKDPIRSDVIKMLYTTDFRDMASFVISKSIEAEPGEVFYYSSGSTNVVQAILKKALGNEASYNNYPWTSLFDPLGMQKVVFEQDGAGTFVGSSYVFMRAEDLAKFGMLYRDGGKWKGHQLISEAWIKKSLEVNHAFKQTTLEGIENRQSYGLGFWLNRDLPSKKEKRPYPSAPEDTFLGIGHQGQLLVVIPSLDLVMVRFGHDKKAQIDRDKLFGLLIDAFTEDANKTAAMGGE